MTYPQSTSRLLVPALAVCLTLVHLGQATAQQVEIKVPDGPVPIGGFCDVEIRGLANRDALAWLAVPEVPVRVYAVWGSGDPILSIPTNRAGTWVLVIAFVEEGKPVLRKVPLTIGDGPAPVPPPDPGPGPQPEPDPPTPTPGKRTVVIVRESADANPSTAILINSLRREPHASYLSSKGHELAILDDDAKDENGQPTSVVEAWRPHYSSMTLPALFIVEKSTKKLLHKQELSNLAISADVIQILKEHGG